MYQNYTDYRQSSYDDYAVTKRINRTSAETRKIMEELAPVDGESVQTFLTRSDIGVRKLIEYSMHQHLFGTRKGAWACHTASRYCFICSTCQYLDILRSSLMQIQEINPNKEYYFNITTYEDQPDTFKIVTHI